ncbi:MAG: hypothetical protein HUJ31_19155 [Pseudomonadales bacterium]|nr:hypothetical protein [Pseudomonadales bacterium]
MRISVMPALILILAVSAPGLNADEPKRSATIPFADLGGIEDWRPVGTEGILIEGRNNKWYKATFFAPCINLGHSMAVGFVTHPGGSVDRFSSIIVDGERCHFKSLEEVPASEMMESESVGKED